MEEEKKQAADAKRRMALLRYIGIMFAVAFVLVAASLVVQMKNSRNTISELNQTNSSALYNAEQLQNQNRELEEEKETLMQENAKLQQELESEKALNEKLLDADDREIDELARQHRDEMEKAQTDFDRTLEVYEALLIAQSCERKEGNVTYSRAMGILEMFEEYLSENGKEAYQKLLQD